MSLINSLRDSIRSLFTPVCCIKGHEQNSGLHLAVLCAGPDQQNQYLLKRIFGNVAVQKTFVGRRPLFSISRMMKTLHCGLAVIAAPRSNLAMIERSGDICVPWWIDSEVDCQMAQGPGKTKGLKNDLRRVRKNKLYFTVANTAEDLRFFFERIYEPTIHASHGAAALPSSFEKRVKQLKSGEAELLFVMKESERVGGVLIVFHGQLPVLREIGVLDGANEYSNLGVVTGAYYFGVEHLQLQGYSRVGSGLSRCFVDDGVFRYKQKWKAKFFGPSRNEFLFRVLQLDEATRAFLLPVDCIAEVEGALCRTRFVHKRGGSGDRVNHFAGPTEIRGVSATQWYDLSGDLPVRCPVNLIESPVA